MGVARRGVGGGGKGNTYRGYFPTQPGVSADNLKEGFEIGAPRSNEEEESETKGTDDASRTNLDKINLSEPNVWPDTHGFSQQSRRRLEQLHRELQSLSSQLLSLLAISLGKHHDFFADYLVDSLSTLRLLHYPPVPASQQNTNRNNEEVKLSCSPHTDSGILTLLHQDSSGGLEVLNTAGRWIAAPYVPGSIVVNIGDLMAKVSGDRFKATMHRVKAVGGAREDGFGRFSVPFFFEPGEGCVVRCVDGEGEEGVVYGEHVRRKMAGWVEFGGSGDGARVDSGTEGEEV